MKNSRQNDFWRQAPALLTAISFLIGTQSLLWAIPWSFYLFYLKKGQEFCIVLIGALYVFFLYQEPKELRTGYFSIATVQPHATPFAKGSIYQGTLYVDGAKVFCSAMRPDHLRADRDYILEGKFEPDGPYRYRFKGGKWKKVAGTWNLAEFRYQMKEKFRKFLDKKLHRPRVASFLSSLITGDVEDRMIRYEFGRVGLQHILAISGFHFAILLSFCSAFLGRLLSPKIRDLSLLLLIFAYFLFVGALPAVQRSALAAALYLIGKLFHRHASGLNLLGVALLVEVLFDPLIVSNLGFQLSFVSCFGILLLAPKINLDFLFPLPESKHRRLLTHYFKGALSISLAVNIAIAPLLFYHFHQFPPLSLLYNLFFPFLVSAAIFSLLLSFMAPPLFALTDWLTAQLLDIAAYPPMALDLPIQASWVAGWMIPPYLFLLFYLTNCLPSDKISVFSGDRSSVG